MTCCLQNRREEKAMLRKQMIKKRNEIPEKQKELWDRQILGCLKAYEEADPCPVYLCYVNYKSEVSTKEFIEWCLNNGKTVFVPKVELDEDQDPAVDRMDDGKEKDQTAVNKADAVQKKQWMVFYRIDSLEELKAGYQGILEPEGLQEKSFSEWVKKQRKADIRMLLPGAAFDRMGNRIGYGGGFYDRWLEKWENLSIERIALAYAFQIVSEIPAEEPDKTVDFMITERGFINLAI